MKYLKKKSINASVFIFIICCCVFLTNAQEKAGTVRKNSIGMELVYIPPGSFIMGSSKAEVDDVINEYKRRRPAKIVMIDEFIAPWVKSEMPQRRMSIEEGFWMGKTEVTQGQWKTVMGTNIRQQKDKTKLGFSIYGEGANYPMYYVSSVEAKEFLRKLNEKNDGFIYSLPTEAQWEYGARAGTASRYYWGDDKSNTDICKYANVLANGDRTSSSYWEGNCRDGYTEIAPVKSFLPNNFGLFDMSGNVWEWCEDIHINKGYNDLPVDGVRGISNGNLSVRIFRGGGRNEPALFARSAMRSGDVPEYRSNFIGFRVVARLKSQSIPKKSNQLVFSSHKDGNQEIYQLNLTTGLATNLSQSGDDDGYPRCSLDGRRIAFATNRDGSWEIYLMNEDGSGQQNLTKNSGGNGYMDWSPDGRTLVFASTRNGQKNNEIYTIRADGTGLKKLTNHPAEDVHPAWSHDGRKIVFASERDGNRQIYVMNADGTNLVRLMSNRWYDDYPVWSPDSSQIAFSSDRDSKSSERLDIYVTSAVGSNIKRVTSHPSDDRHPAWSPDGSQLAFASNRDGDRNIYVVRADGTGLNKIFSSDGDDEHPHWCRNAERAK